MAEEPGYILTSPIRRFNDVWYLHIPKDLGAAWGLSNGDIATVKFLRLIRREQQAK